jgi:hydrogenase nickel incorporation protein HypB
MCTTCGCGAGEVRVEGGALHTHDDGHHHHDHAHEHDQHHAHDGAHVHSHDHVHGAVAHPNVFRSAPAGATRIVQLERDILEKNDGFAQANRRWFAARGIQALNFVSSPGSGKTTLLVKTIQMLAGRRPVAVIEGDQETARDAERIRATGAPALQINTGKGCHLDAHMVGHALERLTLPAGALLLIENVGNLVCPAAFDLGEAHKVVVLSCTEGEDKPLKYPDMFRAASLMLLNKCDLLPHLNFDLEFAIACARRVNPRLEVLQVSATSGLGMQAWLDWLEAHRPASAAMAPRSEGAAVTAEV